MCTSSSFLQSSKFPSKFSLASGLCSLDPLTFLVWCPFTPSVLQMAKQCLPAIKRRGKEFQALEGVPTFEPQFCCIPSDPQINRTTHYFSHFTFTRMALCACAHKPQRERCAKASSPPHSSFNTSVNPTVSFSLPISSNSFSPAFAVSSRSCHTRIASKRGFVGKMGTRPLSRASNARLTGPK